MSKKNFLAGAVIGVLAGAVAGLLLAPRSGKETRKIIKEKAVDYAKKGSEILKEKTELAKKVVKEAADQVSDKLS